MFSNQQFEFTHLTLNMNCSNQIRRLPHGLTLIWKSSENYDSRGNSLATKLPRSQFARREPALSCGRETAQQDINRSQHQTDVLQAYGIISPQFFSTCQHSVLDLSTELAAAPSNVKAIVAGFLG